MYESKTIGALIFFQSLVYFFNSFVLAIVVALPNKILPVDQIGTGLGMINFGGQCAGFAAPMVMGFLATRHRPLRRGVRLPLRHDDPGGGRGDDDQEPRSIS
jgi:hypothetical protein